MFTLRDFKNNGAVTSLSGCGVPGGATGLCYAPHPSHAHLFLWRVFAPLSRIQRLTSNVGVEGTRHENNEAPLVGSGDLTRSGRVVRPTIAISNAQSTYTHEFPRQPRQSKSKRYYDKGRARIIADLGGKCRTCGTDQNLEIHHKTKTAVAKRGTGRGRLDRLVDWQNNFDKLDLLCRPCHLEVEWADHQHEPIPHDNKGRYRCATCGKLLSHQESKPARPKVTGGVASDQRCGMKAAAKLDKNVVVPDVKRDAGRIEKRLNSTGKLASARAGSGNGLAGSNPAPSFSECEGPTIVRNGMRRIAPSHSGQLLPGEGKARGKISGTLGARKNPDAEDYTLHHNRYCAGLPTIFPYLGIDEVTP